MKAPAKPLAAPPVEKQTLGNSEVATPPIACVLVPIRTSRGGNNREHPMARHRRVKAERKAVGLLLRPLLRRTPLPGPPFHVTLTRVAPSRGLDSDNLQGALKGPRDQVAAELGLDDGDASVTWAYAQEKGEWGVRVTIRSDSNP